MAKLKRKIYRIIIDGKNVAEMVERISDLIILEVATEKQKQADYDLKVLKT